VPNIVGSYNGLIAATSVPGLQVPSKLQIRTETGSGNIRTITGVFRVGDSKFRVIGTINNKGNIVCHYDKDGIEGDITGKRHNTTHILTGTWAGSATVQGSPVSLVGTFSYTPIA